MKLILLPIVFFVTSCFNEHNGPSTSSYNDINNYKKKVQTKKYVGWWVFGENLHLFKDAKNLEEYELFFLNETNEEITKFYLEIAEHEFFPIDIEIDGLLYTNEKNQKIIEVSDFFITYVQGCDEQ
tara:strand:- start:129 stop:506 length:378 start_codon:yes stop_codon:yes gene_type:complete